MEVNQTRRGNSRAVYFDDLNGHSIEILDAELDRIAASSR